MYLAAIMEKVMKKGIISVYQQQIKSNLKQLFSQFSLNASFISLLFLTSLSGLHAKSDITEPQYTPKNYTQTKHKILLVHGVTGFDRLGNLVDYFHRIPYHLGRSGAEVFSVNLDFVNNNESRAMTVVNWLESNLGDEEKVNIFAHSQGSPTSRLAAHYAPHYVASITSINGANRGSKLADFIRKKLPKGSIAESAIAAITGAIHR